MPSSEEMAAVLNKGDITVTYTPELGENDKDHAWPFVIGEKNGVSCIQPANTGKNGSFAMLYANVELKAGQALAFDYLSSCEEGGDVLYVLVDRRDIYQISGVMNDWSTCVPYVALEDGTYELALCFLKDSTNNVGEDTVYIKDLRVIAAGDPIPAPAYIPRYCATDLREDKSGYDTYITPVFNEADGYWHVGSVDGPYLLANLLLTSPFSQNTTVYSMAVNGDIKLNGVDYYERLLPYFTMASNATITGTCTVNRELGELLKVVADAVGQEKNSPNQWLQMCSYYDVYGGGVLEDPIKGLSAHSAYEAVVGTNHVNYTHPIMPRGYFYRFVPTATGAYRITSDASQIVEAWIFDADTKTLLMTYSPVERDKLADEYYYNNCTMVAYLEAGKTYYISIAYKDIYATGPFTFELESLGSDCTLFNLTSPGPFVGVDDGSDLVGAIVAGGREIFLHTDGLYHERRADGSVGSIVYVEIEGTTELFTDRSIYSMVYDKNGNLIQNGAFDFSLSEMDHLFAAYYDEATGQFDKVAFDAALGEGTYDMYKEEIIDFMLGTHHGTGEDLTAEMAAYIDAMYAAYEQTPTERRGCIAVDARLAEILDALTDKYVFDDVEQCWKKLTYCYVTYDAVESLHGAPAAN